MTLPLTPFYFVRHGETDWNRQGIIMGSTDIPLNEVGIIQAKESANYLRHYEISTIITSPLQRAVQTAEIIAETKNIPFVVIDQFKECHLGISQGTPANPASPWLTNWQEGLIEEAEPYPDFITRVTDGLHKSLAKKGPVLIVAHRCVYYIIQEILKSEIKWTPNSAIFHHQPPLQPLHPWRVMNIPAIFDNEI